MKKHVLLFCLLWLHSYASVAMTMKHKGPAQSLVEACLKSSALPSPHCGRTPTSVFSENGDLHTVFSQHGHIYYTKSADQGKTFTASTAVNRTPENIYDDGENRPKIKFGLNGEIYISWTHKTPGRYSGDVRFSRSLDGGQSFDHPITVNSDRAITSHRFDSMSVDKQGDIYLVWIDKRAKNQAKSEGKKYPGSAIYFAVSQNSGESFNANRKLVDHSCECCRIALDNDSNGQVVALWRHVYPTNVRDHAIALLSPNTSSIKGEPVKASNDQWVIDGCPHHGPDLSIDQDNRAHMVWFTQGKRNQGLTYGRFNFAKQTTELEYAIDKTAAASRPQVYANGQQVYLMWKRFNGKSMQLLNSYSRDAGKTWSKPVSIANTLNDSDHPDWVVSKQGLFAAWHTQSEGLSMIKVSLP